MDKRYFEITNRADFDRSELDLSDETIRVYNFWMSRQL